MLRLTIWLLRNHISMNSLNVITPTIMNHIPRQGANLLFMSAWQNAGTDVPPMTLTRNASKWSCNCFFRTQCYTLQPCRIKFAFLVLLQLATLSGENFTQENRRWIDVAEPFLYALGV